MSVLPAVDSLLARAESVLARLEAVLPHAATAPDWAASVAFRYRRRGSGCVLEPVRHVATIRLSDLKEVEPQKERLLRNTAQFVAGRGAVLGGRRVERLAFDRVLCFGAGGHECRWAKGARHILAHAPRGLWCR